ncbi:hypothetical protein Dsin_019387 [Dipteronia sinensis]|uniref:Reverse transcriptase domain-containing protein n=1 Tax=Dipteronia sinensis TaxID=43782 RepID=A0AAE0A7A1_9ROSI|nr:hypothetical protein Dsin_019387 [Dipteronia sinensis]
MMFCTWNVRGAGKKGFPKVISDLRNIYNFDVIAILEPRISGSRALKVVNKLGFSDKFLVETFGFSGGIWLLWNGNRVKLQVVASSRHSITAVVAEGDRFWVLTVVYANPSVVIRLHPSAPSYGDLSNLCPRLDESVFDDLNKPLMESFKTGSFPIELNKTLIALVLKIPSLIDMTHIRLISLCNTTYKIISKVIVTRLTKLMHNLICPNQLAFVPGRQIQDNIIVAQEVLHKFKIMKGNKCLFSWKIDLSKAYDRLQWNFIREVIVEADLKGSFVDLIMWCVSTVRYRAVLNGEVTETFTPGCGIRQGDPLSPYLFVLCMEKLSHLINRRVHFGYWKCVKVSRGGPPISHLFFADDFILFGQGSVTKLN